jgi:hypothetical protein
MPRNARAVGDNRKVLAIESRSSRMHTCILLSMPCLLRHLLSALALVALANALATKAKTSREFAANPNPGPNALLVDGLPCTSASGCASASCSDSCCGHTYRLHGRTCVRLLFHGAQCAEDAECLSQQCVNNRCAVGPGRRLSTGDITLPNQGIPFSLVNEPTQGFRFEASVDGADLLLDTGSSSLIFCSSPPSTAGFTPVNAFGCDSYGIYPTPTNQPSVYGAASTMYQVSSVAVDSLGSTKYNLSSAYVKVINSSQGITASGFCTSPLKGIWGMAGDLINDAANSYTSFPSCTIDGVQEYYYPASFPAMVSANDWLFGIYLSYQSLQGQILLGAEALSVTALNYSQSLCSAGVSGSNTNYTFGLVGKFNLTGLRAGAGKTAFGYYQASVTSCALAGYSSINMTTTPAIFDTGTENLQLPAALYNQIASVYPSLNQGTLNCVMPLAAGGSATLSIDLALAYHVGVAQNIYPLQASSDFILGVPLWAQFYTLVDLDYSTIGIYTTPPNSTCAYPTAGPTMRPTTTSSPTTHVPSRSPSHKPSKSPSTSPSHRPTLKPTTSTPSRSPTRKPTLSPSASPTHKPTSRPTKLPTQAPTNRPTTSRPSKSPTRRPSQSPSTSKPSAVRARGGHAGADPHPAHAGTYASHPSPVQGSDWPHDFGAHDSGARCGSCRGQQHPPHCRCGERGRRSGAGRSGPGAFRSPTHGQTCGAARGAERGVGHHGCASQRQPQGVTCTAQSDVWGRIVSCPGSRFPGRRK